MEIDKIGKLAKLFIENHRKSRTLDRLEIKNELVIETPDINNILYKTQDYLSKLGLEMVGVSPTKTLPIDEAKKLFIRKLYIEDIKRHKHELKVSDKKLFTVLSAIQLENNHMHEKYLLEIQKCKLFKDSNVLVYLNGLKQMGLIINNKENDVVFWSLGWRFYVEYCDSFDIYEYFST